MSGFLEFIRKQGVVGLATGFILGGAVSKLVTALVEDIINPILGIFLGRIDGLKNAVLSVGPVKILWGAFLGVLVDFLVIALVVYYGIRWLKLDKLEKKE